MSEPRHLGRRTLLGCAALCGVSGPILSACSSGNTTEGAASDDSSPSTTPATKAGSALATAADVPVGGGMVLTDLEVVVTQPAKGEFKAFSAVCTHQGCVVEKVEDGEISCPCHGSRFDVEDGDVTSGPATEPLPEIKVEVRDGQVVRV